MKATQYVPVAEVKEDGKDNLYSTDSYNGKIFDQRIHQATQPVFITEICKYVEDCHKDDNFKFHSQFEVNSGVYS